MTFTLASELYYDSWFDSHLNFVLFPRDEILEAREGPDGLPSYRKTVSAAVARRAGEGAKRRVGDAKRRLSTSPTAQAFRDG